MKLRKLAASILILGTVVISPKVNAQNLLTPQELSPLENSISPSSKNVDIGLEQGFIQMKLGDFRGAIANFNQIIDIDPNNAYAYFGRGFSRLPLGDYRDAKKDFDKAIEIDPNNAYAYLGRGISRLPLGDLGDYRDAKKDFDKAIEIDPNNAHAHMYRGSLVFMLGDKQGAIADWKQASILFKEKGEDQLSQMLDNLISIYSNTKW
jgi:tetratricopeptide (TPR) repeat protein